MADTREVWNYKGKYKISNPGHVKSLERQVSYDSITRTQAERIMCHRGGKISPYGCVRIYKGGVGQKLSIHRLVVQHFLPGWNSGLEVNHTDGNRDNNRANNLKMCTHQRNMEHAIAGGLKRDYCGISVNTKLTNEQAGGIRRSYLSGVMQNEPAEQFKVCKQMICDIVHYKKYKNESDKRNN